MPALINAIASLINGAAGDPTLGTIDSVDGDDSITKIMDNIVRDFDQLQFFVVNVVGYLLGLLFAIAGVLKLREYSDNPAQVPLKSVIIRFVAGGMLLALPTVIGAMSSLINGGVNDEFDVQSGFDLAGLINNVGGSVMSFGGEFNSIMKSIEKAFKGTEDLIKAVAYLLGIFIAFGGVVKLKEHVDSPDQVPLKEPVTRFITAGALLALPAIFQAVSDLITGDGQSFLGGVGGALGDVAMTSEWFNSKYKGGDIFSNVAGGVASMGGGSFGNMLSNIQGSFFYAPAFLTAMAYTFALVLTLWGVLKVRDHVNNPGQVSIWEGASRLIAAGLFFALPITIDTVKKSMSGTVSGGISGVGNVVGVNYNEGALACENTGLLGGLLGGGGNSNSASTTLVGLTGNDDPSSEAIGPGLDTMLGCFMSDIIGPMHTLITFFGYVAGIILIMIGISRLMKSAQEGARGPGGIGTMMTFAAGGALMSFNGMITAITRSVFGMDEFNTRTFATLGYKGIDSDAQEHMYVVISSVLKFMIIIGLVSFIRGIFIMRSVAEGNGQASMMSAVTHIIGGAIAINLGAFINAIHASLGLDPAASISFAAGEGGGAGLLGGLGL